MKKILVIDDHRETVELIRSLIMAGRDDAVVLAASSAEVALRVMRQTSFDLLIADDRLPGIPGYELVRIIRRSLPDLPVIMVTGHSIPEVRRKALQIGVDYFLAKPFSAPELLEMVDQSLSGKRREKRTARKESVAETTEPVEIVDAKVEHEAGPLEEADVSESLKEEKEAGRLAVEVKDEPAPPQEIVPLPEGVKSRLAALRSDTDAYLVLLASADGQVELWEGNDENLQLDKLARVVADSARGGLKVSESLESDEPFSIQYQVGRHYNLFSANVGRRHALAVIISTSSGRGRIGPVWLFTQRAVNDLQKIIYHPPGPPPAEEPSAPRPEPAATTPAQSKPVETRPELVVEDDRMEAMVPEVSTVDDQAELVESRAEQELPAEEEADALSGEQELDQLLDELLASHAGEEDVDQFWDEALSAGLPADGDAQTFSLEEALNQGLIPPELFEPEEDAPGESPADS